MTPSELWNQTQARLKNYKIWPSVLYYFLSYHQCPLYCFNSKQHYAGNKTSKDRKSSRLIEVSKNISIMYQAQFWEVDLNVLSKNMPGKIPHMMSSQLGWAFSENTKWNLGTSPHGMKSSEDEWIYIISATDSPFSPSLSRWCRISF